MRRAGRRPRGPMAQNAKFNFPTGRHISAGRRLEVSKDKRGSQSQISVNICASSPPCCFLRVHRLTLNASINCLTLQDPAKDTFHCGLSPQVLKGLRHLIGKKEAPCTGRWQAGDFKLLISPTGTLCSPQKPNVVDRHVLDILSAKKAALRSQTFPCLCTTQKQQHFVHRPCRLIVCLPSQCCTKGLPYTSTAAPVQAGTTFRSCRRGWKPLKSC